MPSVGTTETDSSVVGPPGRSMPDPAREVARLIPGCGTWTSSGSEAPPASVQHHARQERPADLRERDERNCAPAATPQRISAHLATHLSVSRMPRACCAEAIALCTAAYISSATLGPAVAIAPTDADRRSGDARRSLVSSV